MPGGHKLDGKFDEIVDLKRRGLTDVAIANYCSGVLGEVVTDRAINYQVKKARKMGLLPSNNKAIESPLIEEEDVASTKLVMGDSLTAREQSKLQKCLQVIAYGFSAYVEMGQALATIRDEKLYRESHETFEEFVEDVVNVARSRAYQLMNRAEVFVEMSNFLDKSGNTLPRLKEAHVAELARIENVEDRAKVWNSLEQSQQSGNMRLTAKAVRAEVEKHFPSEHKERNTARLTLRDVAANVKAVVALLRANEPKKALSKLEALAEALPRPKKA